QPGLADPGRSGDDDQVTGTAPGVGEAVAQVGEFLGPPDQLVRRHAGQYAAPAPAQYVPALRTGTDVGRPDSADGDGMGLKHAVEQLFQPAAQPGRIGAEVELIPVTLENEPAPVDPGLLAAGFDADFAREAVPSFEPGGQLELSPPPRPSAAALT